MHRPGNFSGAVHRSTLIILKGRTSLDNLLDPDNMSVTLKTLERAATVLGKRLQIALVDIDASDAAVVT